VLASAECGAKLRAALDILGQALRGVKPSGWRAGVPTMYFCRFAPARRAVRHRPETA
jgi:hypothetical protein